MILQNPWNGISIYLNMLLRGDELIFFKSADIIIHQAGMINNKKGQKIDVNPQDFVVFLYPKYYIVSKHIRQRGLWICTKSFTQTFRNSFCSQSSSPFFIIFSSSI